jgi:hypothetical protein
MPSTQTPISEADRSTPSATHPLVEAVRAHLLALKQPVDAEIRAYPPPIPGCDAQFNHLLDQRTGLSRALVRLEEIADQGMAQADEARALDAFISACGYIDANAAKTFRKKLG